MKELLIEQMNSTSRFLRDLPMTEIKGNTLKQNGKEFNLISIIGCVRIDKSLIEDYNTVLTDGLESKAKSIGRKYTDVITNGRKGNFSEFDGLDALAETTNVIDKKDALDYLVINNPDFILMRYIEYSKFKNNFEIKRGDAYFKGAKIYINDYIRPSYCSLLKKVLYWLATKIKVVKPPEYDIVPMYSGKFGANGIFGIRAEGDYPVVEDRGEIDGEAVHVMKAYLGLCCANNETLTKAVIRI